MSRPRQTGPAGPERRDPKQGFTLMELLVVVSIMVFMTGILMASWTLIQGNTILEGTGSKIANMFLLANTRAIIQKVPQMVVINRGEGTVQLISAGPDKRFAVLGENPDQEDQVSSFANDDERDESKKIDLRAISQALRIERALNQGGLDGSVPVPRNLEEEPLSAVFIFTTKGVKYGSLEVDPTDGSLGFIELRDDLQSTPDSYNQNLQADVVLSLKDGKTLFMMNVDSITGRSYSKVILKSRVTLLNGGTK